LVGNPDSKSLTDVVQNVIFQRTMNPSAFATVFVASEEVRTEPSYFFDNATRPDDVGGLVVQRTVRGAAFFEGRTGRRLVQPGFAMLFTHREPSRYGYPPDASVPYQHQYIEFTSSPSLRKLFDQLRRDFGSVIRLPDDSEARTLFSEILKRFRMHSFLDRYHESELLYRLLIAIYREQVQETRVSDPIEYGYHYLHNRFRSPINLKGVAETCGVSREHLGRAFRKRYKELPGALLRRLRLEHGRTMLLVTSLPVEEVALASGFTSTNTFNRAYRQHFGMSPGASRTKG
jgi:AraC-like DNA-binding protein